MKIAGVTTAVVEANYDWTFVRVDADDEGLSGIGECFCAPGITGIIRDIAPLLIGEDARDVDRLWAKLRWGSSGAGSSAGIVYNAISGIEAALWDLVGQHYGVPIHRLLGGRFRDSIRMYATATPARRCTRWTRRWSSGPRAGPRTRRRRSRPARSATPSTAAVRQGRPDEVFTPELTPNGRSRLWQPRLQRAEARSRRADAVPAGHRVRHVRGPRSATWSASPPPDRRLGDEVDAAFDCHWRYQVSDAQRLAHELEPLGLMWLEDPVPPENVQALRRVTTSTSTPIATGENGYMRHGFREAFECGAIDIAAPDPQKTGGLLETRRIADYADTHYISMAPHCIASPIGTIANVHVCAAIPNFLALSGTA